REARHPDLWITPHGRPCVKQSSFFRCRPVIELRQRDDRMTQFRLTQISDTHLARRLTKLTQNFERVANYIDATRPDLVLNTGDVGFDGPTSTDDLDYARSLHDALPVPCRFLPGNHDIGDNPTQIGPVPTQLVSEKARQFYISVFGDDRWRFEAAGW